MKTKLNLIGLLLTLLTCNSNAQHTNTATKPERISKTASFVVKGSIDQVFPLFGAFEERKWAEGWDPQLVYPSAEVMEEGTTFKTVGHGHDALWVVTKFDSGNHLVQYLVSTENRFWTITVKCSAVNKQKTEAEVTYTYTGLNTEGNELNRRSLHQMFQNNLQDWATAINQYLNG